MLEPSPRGLFAKGKVDPSEAGKKGVEERERRRVLRHLGDPSLAELQGLTNDQIAQRMEIAPSTVKTQLSDAFRRLGVQNRTEAALAFVRIGHTL